MVATPLVQSLDKVLDRLTLRPEISQEFGWIFAKSGALFGDQFFNRRVAGMSIPLCAWVPVFGRIQNESQFESSRTGV